MTEKTEIPKIPDGFKDQYKSWHGQYIEEDKEWVWRVKNNPFIAIDKHINEDTITDLLAHILQTDKSIKTRFLNFLLNEGGNTEVISDEVAINKTEIKTQEWIRNDNKISRLDLLIIIDNKYYIVIENKIFDAPEQPKQMERYIKGITEKLGAMKENVLAFYATPDGQGKFKTAREYNVKPLAFYSDNPQIQTIYSVLMDVKNSIPPLSITQDFCFYLMYRFNNPQSVSFFQDQKEDKSICWEAYLNELFIKDGPSISKNINAYAYPKNYFIQLLKVHALNRYLLKEFNKDNCSYHAVFDGIRVKRQAKIGGTDYNVYFETKYYKNDFFMVITIYSLNKIEEKTLSDLFGGAYKFLEIDNNEFIYSLWLWIQDPKSLKKSKDKEYGLKFLKEQFSNIHIAGGKFDNGVIYFKNYNKYIDFIFNSCMQKIFEGISSKSKKEDYSEALNIFCGIYY